MQLTVNSRTITLCLVLIVALLTALHSAVLLTYFIIDDPSQFDFIRIIDFDYEGNIPTLFSALLLIVSAALFWVLAQLTKQKTPEHRKYWLGLSLIFLFLGIDEGTKIHEYLGDWVKPFIDASGYLYYPWVLPYMLVFLLLVAAYFKFYLSLPRSIKVGLFISAGLYLFGAVFLDMLGGKEAEAHGTTTILYSVLYTIEEVLEMLGVIVLIRTLLNYVEQQMGEICLVLEH